MNNKLPLKKYYTYLDEIHSTISPAYCSDYIQKILTSYSQGQFIRLLSHISIEFGLSNNPESILLLQEKQFNVPATKNVYFVHRQATLTLFQFVCSIPSEKFTSKTDISTRDVFLLYILVNQLLEFTEYYANKKALGKSLFFTSIKSIHLTQSETDLRGSFELFQQYYVKMVELNKNKYDEIIQDSFCLSIDEFVHVMDLIKGKNYREIFSLFDKFAVVRFEEIYKKWNERTPKLSIPFEISFLEKYPLIKIGNEYFLTDANNLINGLFRIVYEKLFQNDKEGFKSDFGLNIVEPVIIKLLEETFVSEKIKQIKVFSKSYQWADFGLLHNQDIFLFEIKSSILKKEVIYASDYNYFIRNFNDKFVVKEGIKQQVQKILEIEKDYNRFCQVTKIDPKLTYKIHPILLSFDESLQAFCCNWYLSTRFDNLIRICNLKPSKFDLAKNHSTLTFNELFRMKELSKSKEEKISLLKKYSDESDKPPMSLIFYLQYHNLL